MFIAIFSRHHWPDTVEEFQFSFMNCFYFGSDNQSKIVFRIGVSIGRSSVCFGQNDQVLGKRICRYRVMNQGW
jgi:hypothetical protein